MRNAVIPFTFAIILAASTPARGQLGPALNNTNLTWTTSGTGGGGVWFAESSVSHDGVSAAQAGSLFSASQSSTLQTAVTGPGTLTFWWLDSSFNNNTLSFGIDTSNVTYYIMSPLWEQQTFYLGTGTHTLKWVSSYGPAFGNRYVDEVSYVPGLTTPIITDQPASQSQVPGLDATFTVGVGGTPPLAYQWQFNGTNLSNATNSSLIVSNISTLDLGSYSVVVTNIAGPIVSSNATLEFGEVTAWGLNNLGQASVPTGMTNVLAIAAGHYHSLALKADGTVIAWGNLSANPLTPVAANSVTPAGLSNITTIASADSVCMALKANGELIAWGDNYNGQTNVPPALSNVVAATGGVACSLALKSDGTIVAWGNNLSNQTNVPAGLSNVVVIAAGFDYSMALRADGTVVAWGNNSSGQTNVPSGLSNIAAIAGGTGARHALALKPDGTVIAWGNNSSGETNVPPGLSNVVAIANNWRLSLALKADGTVVAWGENSYSRTNVPRNLTNVVAICSGGYHELALVRNGPVLHALATNPSINSNCFTLSLPTQSGRVFALEYTDSFEAPVWTALPLVAGNGFLQILVDPGAANTQRFYRVRRW